MIIIDSLIRRRLKAIMKEFIEPLLELVKYIIDRSGMKSLVAGAGIYGLWYLADADKLEGWIAAIGIAVVAGAFFAFRRVQEKEAGGQK